MIDAFGGARTIRASDKAKSYMKQLENLRLFREQGDVWRLGASLGILTNNKFEGAGGATFQNVNSLDPDGILAAIMFGLYPEMDAEERLKLLISYAEWGIREIFRLHELGTLDFSTLGLVGKDRTY